MEDEKDISQLNVKEAFYTIQQFLDEIGEKDEDGKPMYEDLPNIYKKGRYGLKIKFDIYDYINETIGFKTKTGQVCYRSKTFKLSEFWTELEDRAIIMKKWLKQNNPEVSAINPYGSKRKK